MLIFGLKAFHGDASAALRVDGHLTAAVEEERFNRIKTLGRLSGAGSAVVLTASRWEEVGAPGNFARSQGPFGPKAPVDYGTSAGLGPGDQSHAKHHKGCSPGFPVGGTGVPILINTSVQRERTDREHFGAGPRLFPTYAHGRSGDRSVFVIQGRELELKGSRDIGARLGLRLRQESQLEEMVRP